MNEQEPFIRFNVLDLAARVYGADHPPQALVEAAEQFLEFVLGENLEVQD